MQGGHGAVHGHGRSAQEEAMAFLAAELAEGPVEANTVQANARRAGMSERTLSERRKG